MDEAGIDRAARRRHISGGAMWDDGGVGVVSRVLHAKRREDVVGHELLVARAGHLLDHVPEHEIARVAVAHFLAGGEIERLVAHRRDRLRDGRVPELQRVVVRQAGEVGNPGRVRQQVEDRDPVPRRGRFGDVFPDRVLELQLAAFLEQQNGRGGELLRDRAKPEPGRGRVGNVPLEVRRTVALVQDDVGAARDEHRPHEGLVADVGLHDLLHARGVLSQARGRDKEDYEGASKDLHAPRAYSRVS